MDIIYSKDSIADLHLNYSQELFDIAEKIIEFANNKDQQRMTITCATSAEKDTAVNAFVFINPFIQFALLAALSGDELHIFKPALPETSDELIKTIFRKMPWEQSEQ